MSSAYIKLLNSLVPITPSSGYSNIYIDSSDNHLKRKKDNGDIVDYDTNTSTEAIQDLVGAMVTDTTTIDLTYDDPNGLITADIQPSSINDTHVDKISPTKIQDDFRQTIENSITTINNVSTLIYSENITQDSSILYNVEIVGRRTGGAAGNPGDACIFKRDFRLKSIALTNTIHNVQSTYTSRDNSNFKITITMNVNTLEIYTVGDVDNTIKWNLILNKTINK